MTQCSIVIPSYNHAAYLAEAVNSALAQTVTCDVIVVDDGSTDQTDAVLSRYGDRVRVIRLPHGGPSLARNAGIDAAQSEFVMLLDADDVIAPTKIERQLSAFDDAVGWVLCDTRIEDAARNRVTTASAQYDYARKELGGWVSPLLDQANFVPIMAPLVRRSVLGDVIRFSDKDVPEDWAFWRKVAASARLRYLPEVLATYRKRPTGRSRLPKASRKVNANITAPLRLNLGCGTPGTRSWHPINGFVNLDKSVGWYFEDGLGEFADHTVAGVSVSHAAMYVALEHWPFVFSEIARVLAVNGVVRITEDDTTNPQSARYGGWKGSEPAVTLTDAAMVKAALERAGLFAYDVDANTSKYRDKSLCQAQHGTSPDVFFVEGKKLSGVVFAPHSDDEALWASFTLLRHRPNLVVCFKSARDYGPDEKREEETRSAAVVLGASSVEFWDGGDMVAKMKAYDERVHPVRVWAPDRRTSHPEHLVVAEAADAVFGDRVTTFHTYDEHGKVRVGTPVPFEPAWTLAKLRALARYETQIYHPRANQWFMNDLLEFYGVERRDNAAA